ncbi:MAG TPA: hypothetical protein VMV11_06180 [Acidimicrobiales bacterium]|nr:hypothetical protein [Acidimicrobiales bacterium]
MRRLVALFVIALLGAALYGVSSSSSGLVVNHQTLSANTLNTELSAISHNNTLQCFVTALSPTSYAPGAGGYSIKASGAAAWANLRVEGLAIDQYVTTTLKYHPSAHDLALAESSLEGEMTAQASANSLTCPGTSVQALAAMPSEMRSAEILAQADSLYLVQKIKTTIPLTTASMKSYYAQHTSSYDTLCVSVALVLPASVTAFAQGEASGLSVTALVKKFSQDPASAAKGGAVGCFSPTSTSYANVRGDVASLGLNTFATTPNYISNNGQTYALYVAVTKRTPTPFSAAAATVLADLQSLNASSANSLKNGLLQSAAVHVDPAFGRWGLNTTGPSVFASAVPATSDVTGTTKLSTTAATYK